MRNTGERPAIQPGIVPAWQSNNHAGKELPACQWGNVPAYESRDISSGIPLPRNCFTVTWCALRIR